MNHLVKTVLLLKNRPCFRLFYHAEPICPGHVSGVCYLLDDHRENWRLDRGTSELGKDLLFTYPLLIKRLNIVVTLASVERPWNSESI